MALMPKRVKFRKQHRGRVKGEAHRGNEVSFGEYGLQALEAGWISARQIEAARIAINHLLKGEGRIWIRIFPHKSVTSTPEETRMGKGKGEIEYWCAVVRPGTILYEVAGIDEQAAKTALVRAAHKLPMRTRFAVRRHKV
jgi:large subunit ribosomal protein L16